jgi:uncharacterized membrane protein
MNTNPRFAVLLANYVLYDRLTLLLATAALVAVLFGFLLARTSRGGSQTRPYGQVVGYAYYGFLITTYIVVLVGTLILL